ncbi:MAG TPA: hypothetical protein IAB60_13020 [Candidatus Caccovicinus merdipullorum]|mgnify:FL=1|uniref:Uncharacterized protein n=1 Tax=Candidatus Caccovicinus merdipullorum TaxID=2840724 RepID=A0A9D1GKU2_9FIRM|nr:hypothetical protein [Candidatus Caccovicinus merdipullorum]
MERMKRPLAIVCLILMGVLIAGAVILALIGTEEAARLLMADLFCLIVIPAVFYGYQMLLNMIKKKEHDNEKDAS